MSLFYIHELLENPSSYALSLLSFSLAIVVLYTLFHKHDHAKNRPPSPPKLLVIGNLHQLGKYPHRSLRSLSQKHGDLMLLHFGSKPTLVVSSADAAKEIMKTHDLTFSNRPKLKMVQKLFYNCKDVAFSNYGEYWRQMKSICVLHLLSNRRVRSFRTIREEETALLMDKIRAFGTKETINLSEVIVTLTNDVVCRAAFGRKYRGKDGKNFTVLVDKFVGLVGERSMGDIFPWMSWIDKLNGLESKANEVAEAIDIFLEEVLEEHLDVGSGHRNGDKGDGSEKFKDFMDILVEILRDDQKLGLAIDRESIKALILDMFTAGTETTFALIEWAMSELLRHPTSMNKLQQEVTTISQHKPIVNEDSLENMKYLKAVIKETLRLYPPVPLLLSRESTKDVEINGYEIQARTQVIVNAWAIHRDPSVWEKPDEFYPERFLTSSVDFKGQNFELIPFGAGRRMCPGVQFAVVNAEVVLANLVNGFDWELARGAKGETEALSMEEKSGITMHRRIPLLVAAAARSV